MGRLRSVCSSLIDSPDPKTLELAATILAEPDGGDGRIVLWLSIRHEAGDRVWERSNGHSGSQIEIDIAAFEKRHEKGTFRWPSPETKSLEWSSVELAAVIGGIDLIQTKKNDALRAICLLK